MEFDLVRISSADFLYKAAGNFMHGGDSCLMSDYISRTQLGKVGSSFHNINKSLKFILKMHDKLNILRICSIIDAID